MRWPWRRAAEKAGEAADIAAAEAAAARMRETLVPLNEQLHALASHITTMRAALASARRRLPLPEEVASIEAALAAAEATYQSSLRTRDAILTQAEALQSRSRDVHAALGSRAAREACSQAALQAEERVQKELFALAEATARLDARRELDNL
jgi:hypothetical protein